jgi:hypothetical protein
MAQIQQGVVAVIKAWGEEHDANTTATRQAWDEEHDTKKASRVSLGRGPVVRRDRRNCSEMLVYSEEMKDV